MVSLTEPAALEWLEAQAARVPAGVIVELGVHQGGSLTYLARGARANPRRPHVYGIDPWGLPGPGERYNRLRHRYHEGNEAIAQAAAPTAELIRGFSTQLAEVWEPPVGLLYVDALHTLEAVRADIAAWSRHLLIGAVVCFDDYSPKFPGVVAAVDELGEPELIGSRMAVLRW